MAFLSKGTPIGTQDEFLRPICVGDTVTDAKGITYTINKYGRARQLGGSKECSPSLLKGLTVTEPWNKDEAPKAEPAKQEENEERKYIEEICTAVKDAGDQTLVDELRLRGWKVTCEKLIEKVVFETVAL